MSRKSATSTAINAPKIGERLMDCRELKGESLREAAAEIGCSAKHLWSIESGAVQRPANDLLVRLADHYDLSLDDLFGRESRSSGDRETLRLASILRSLPAETRDHLLALAESIVRHR